MGSELLFLSFVVVGYFHENLEMANGKMTVRPYKLEAISVDGQGVPIMVLSFLLEVIVLTLFKHQVLNFYLFI